VQKLPPEIKSNWLTALRSGNYKQGSGYLHTESDHYCCLGVLCEVMGLKGEFVPGSEKRLKGHYVYDGSYPGALPQSVRDVTGLDDFGTLPTTVRYRDTNCNDLANLNDNGATFLEIAGIIEKQL
jgi:hypothetical protein